MRALSLAALAAAALSVAGARGAAADSSVVRGARLADLGVTPTLGRGYSPGANTMQSVCFDTLPTTSASFDFDYAFEDLELDQQTMAKLDRKYTDDSVGQFIRDNTRETVVVRSSTQQYVHYLLAVLTVDSYYSSIDEGKARLGDAALRLLHGGAVLDFFLACGTHYIRSISRRSYFLTLFSYTTTKRERDSSFELSLEESVRRLDPDGVKSKAEAERDAQFSDQATQRDLRIVTKSIGLRPETAGDLIPFDLASYKDTVRTAFKASQDDTVGRITAMEVVPWASNPVFLASIDLGDQNVGGKLLTRFERKQLLDDNAEFYIAIAGIAQQREEREHRALQCRQDLDQHILVNGAIPPALANAQVVNHRTGELAPLAQLVDALSPAKLAELDAAQHRFANGDDGKGGASQCIEQLERGALTTVAHHEIPACEAVQSQGTAPNASMIDDYCQPELAR